jgi:hypothetical protein
MIHPFDYQLQQAFVEDWQQVAAQQRLVVEATRSLAECRRLSHVLRAAAACLRWPAVQARLVKLDETLTSGSA